ncbi:hypothetical protein [Polyangium fumosum]|uniref:Uncharacterized protein n=1 Tax=Polyangium fumosum TaxID=889272 RepID=A0A4U1IX59_9BACT|nr:hypothetical protein [Polyangium fumosum]TKC99120.1 hypothetical protein E8A74_38960 [Polyangium fumosum]
MIRLGSLVLPALLLALPACSRGDASTDASPLPVVSSRPAPAPRPAGPAELALVAPLAPGSTLDGFAVREIRAVQDGVLMLVCEKDRAVVRLSVALAVDDGPTPPAFAGRYAVFYSARGSDPADGERLAKALAAILEKHPDVPVPPGMTSFVPTPIPI